MTPIEHRVDELLTIELNWQDGTTIDLSSGYTASVRIVRADAPTDLVVASTSVTLAATSPNYVIALSPTNLADLVTAWGGTLDTYGDVFRLEPRLIRTSDSMPIPWSGRRVEVRLYPAPT